MENIVSSIIDWGIASLPFQGNYYSGDAYAIRPSDGSVIVAAIDGLGHGEDAHEASSIAVNIIITSDSDDLFRLVGDCHAALAKTRGAVMSLACFNTKLKTMTWMGVGNVEGYLKRADADAVPSHESLFLRGGCIGYQLPSLRSSVIAISPGDTLIFATDGISSNYDREANLQDSPQQIADRIMSKCSKKTDDALVLVARYIG